MTAYQSIKRIWTVGSRHPRQIARVRIVIGTWLLFLMTVLYSTGHGGHWAWLLGLGTAVHWVWACFLFRIDRRRGADPRLTLHLGGES
jgi:hypothetical protein